MNVRRFALLAAGMLLAGCPPPSAHPPQAGRDLYQACKACHGSRGEGQRWLAAPAIAGLPQWYVAASLRKFRTGIRGAHPDDPEGLRMRPMSRQMRNELEVDAVAGFVASMPPVKAAATVAGGDPSAGKVSFAVCQACHGPAALGNEQLRAPPLAGQADWYLLATLKKFKAGIRGAAPGDLQGAQMRPMAMTLADEQAMKNVIAYITTFPR